MKAKIYVVLIALVTSLSLCAQTSGTCGDNLTWTLQDSVLTISGMGEMANSPWHNESITTIIIGDSVTSICNYAFDDCYNLTSVSIGNAVTTIGKQAFEDCGSLTSITLGNSVTTIGTYAFEWCKSLSTVNLDESIISIGPGAFYGCESLASISFPNSLKTIEGSAFSGCSGLTSVFIPSSVETIGQNPFESCKNLESISVDANNTKYDSRDNCNAIIETATNKLVSGCKNTAIPNSVLVIGNFAFEGCKGLGSFPVFNSVTEIGEYAFTGCPFTTVTIPDGVTSVGDDAFSYCDNLTSISIPYSVVSFEGISYCDNLTSVTINSNHLINRTDGHVHYLFGGYVKEFILGDSIKTIPFHAFLGCETMTSISIGNNVTYIGNSAFQGCNRLTSVIIPSSVDSFGGNPFDECSSLTSISVDANNTKYDSRDNCNAIIETATNKLISGCKNTTIPNSVTTIGLGSFDRCTGLTSITLPNSVTKIEEYAFYHCFGLTSLIISDSVINIGEKAFEDVPNIVYSGSATGSPWGAKSINGAVNGWFVFEDTGKTILAACSSVATDTVVIPNGVTTIRHEAFLNCSGITSISIPNSVTSIESSAFKGCSGLTEISLPNSISSIENQTFQDCKSLISVTIPSSVTSIGSSIFNGCSKLSKVNCLSSTPATLANDAFNGVFYYCYVYVPCGSVDNYKSKWGNNSWRIKEPLHNYTIRGKVNDALAGVVTVPQSICEDTIISATANVGYHFAHWSDGDTINPRPFALTQDTIFTAIFEKTPYSLTTAVNNTVYGKVIGDTTAFCLDTIRVEAITNYGHHFVQWNDGETINPRFVVLTQDTSFTATFAKNSYSLTTAVENPASGTITSDTTALYLDTINVEAFPAVGYRFIRWNDGETTNPRAIVLTQDTSLVAVIKEIKDGSCGDNLTWTLEDSVLTISGSGAMTVWGHTEDVPWYAQRTLITQITVGDSVTSISKFAFSECSNLKSVHVEAPVPPIAANTLFANVVPVYVPDTSVAAYQAADYWKNYPIVGNFSGYGGMCGNNAGWALNDSVLVISGRGNMTNYSSDSPAPWPKNSVKTIIIGNAITGIGSCAFDGCRNLDSLQIDATIKSIERYTFHDCVSLKSFVVPNSVKNIGEGAFSGCTGLKTLVMGESVEFIGNYVFSSCNNLDTMYMLPPSPPSLGNYSLPSNTVYVLTGCSYDKYYNKNISSKWNDYRDALYEPIINLNLTLENNNPELGSVRIIKVRDREVRCDSSAVIQAFPKEGCTFDGWSTGSHNLLDTVYLVSDSTITASFSGNPSPHLVTFVVSPADSCGSIFIGDTIAKDSIYEDGKTLKLVAVPAEGYMLDYWSTGANTDSIRVTVDSTMTVTAYFVPASWGKTKQGTCGDNLTWALSNGVLKISGEGAMADYATSGENLAPWFQDSIASLIIGDSITTIGKCAFSGCEYLTSVTIPTSVTTIQESAFSRCIRMKEVFIGDSVQKILNYAFSGCTELDTIYMMPPTPPSVGNSALPTNASMVIILKGCDAFNVYTANNAGAFKDLYRRYLRDPIVDLKLIVESDNIRKGSVEIVPFAEHNNVLIRCDSTAVIKATPKPGCRFDHWSDGATDTLHTVQLVSDSTIIKAFFEGERDSLWVEFMTRCSTDTVDSCGFIYLEDTIIAKSGLYRDSTVLNLVAKPDSGYIFDYWSTGDTTASISLTVDSAMTLTAYFTHESWGKSKRGSCGDKLTWTLSNGVLKISGEGAMADYETAGDRMLPWYLDSIASIVIGDSVTVIGKNAFNSCSYVRSADIPTSVVRIQEQAFSRCDSLRTIIIGGSVKAIGNYAFSGCNMLDTIYMMPPTPPSLGSYSLPNQAKIILKGCSYDEYQAAVDSLASWKPYEKALRDPIINFNFSVELEDSLLEQGTIIIDTIHNGTVIRCDSTVVIEAIPKNGCKFERWSNGSYRNPDTVKLVGDDTIRAIFSGTPKPIYYHVNFNTNPVDGGNIHLGDSLAVSGDFEKGQTLNLEAVPANGYIFSHWNNGTMVNKTSLRVTMDSTITAMFLMIPHDTIEVHDTTFIPVHDTTTVTEYVSVHDTAFIQVHDTTIVKDTVWQTMFDTVYIDQIPDTIEILLHDTIRVRDTLELHFRDTVEIERIVHDTIENRIEIHDTTTVIVHDTLRIPEVIHDTVHYQVVVHDTTTIEVHDTLRITIQVRDTIETPFPVYIHDTTEVQIFVHDTTEVTVPIYVHDTTLVQMFDTAFIPIEVHDTMYMQVEIRDTMFVPYPVHDTTIVNIYDTTRIIVHDTTKVTVPVYIYDTAFVQVHDTSYIPIEVRDTMYMQVEIRDTMFVPFPVHDTTYVTEYVYVRDTTYLPIEVVVHDTMYVTEYITDTMWMTRFDTIYIRDTIYINDSMPTNASQVEYINVKVYASYGQIVVEGANGRLVTLYSASGQLMAKKQDEDDLLYFDVPTSGAYLVKIGNVAVKQIVVKK